MQARRANPRAHASCTRRSGSSELRLLARGRMFEERDSGPCAVKLMVVHAHPPLRPPSSGPELPIRPELKALILECLGKDAAKAAGACRGAPGATAGRSRPPQGA